MKLKIHSTGLIFGFFVALMHLFWSIMVYFNWAGLYLNWIFSLHFLNNPFKVAAFDWAKALWLILFTFIVGYICGVIFSTLWNKLHK